MTSPPPPGAPPSPPPPSPSPRRASGRRRRSSSSSATSSPPTRPRARARERFKEAAPRSAPRARSRSRSTRTASSTRTRRRWRRCSSARCRCSRRRCPSSAPLGVKEFEVFDLPFIFNGLRRRSRKVTDGPVGKRPVRQARAQGHQRPGVLGQRLQSFMSANKPLHKPADFKGLKMRIQSSKVLDAQMRALGAIPQVMAFSRALPGAADRASSTAPRTRRRTSTRRRCYEVQKHITISNHGHLGYAVIVNKKFWDGLPADIRGQLDAGDEGRDQVRQRRSPRKENDDALAKIKATGKTEIYAADHGRARGLEEGAAAGPQGDGVARRQGDRSRRSTRKPASTRPRSERRSGDARLTAGGASGGIVARAAARVARSRC